MTPCCGEFIVASNNVHLDPKSQKIQHQNNQMNRDGDAVCVF